MISTLQLAVSSSLADLPTSRKLSRCVCRFLRSLVESWRPCALSVARLLECRGAWELHHRLLIIYISGRIVLATFPVLLSNSHFIMASTKKGLFGRIFRKHSLRTNDKERTSAAELTLRQSIYPLCLVTILFFLWASFQSHVYNLMFTHSWIWRIWQGFSYGLLDTLNKHFQVTLGITRARSSGLQAAYFGYVISL